MICPESAVHQFTTFQRGIGELQARFLGYKKVFKKACEKVRKQTRLETNSLHLLVDVYGVAPQLIFPQSE
jgi:hypothetical protein